MIPSRPRNTLTRAGKSPAPEKESGDSASSAAKTADQKKGDEKKTDAKKSDEKKPTAEKEAAAKETAAKPSTLKLKKGPFRIEVALDGVFEAQNQAELFIRPQEWVAVSPCSRRSNMARCQAGRPGPGPRHGKNRPR